VFKETRTEIRETVTVNRRRDIKYV